MQRLSRLAGERGSIPMALLAVIVVGFVVSVVVSRTIAESRATQFDNEYTTVLHVAEAGIDDALFRLNNRLFPPGATTLEGDGTVNGLDFAWTATRQADLSWVAESTGSGWNGVERTIVAEIRDQPIFHLTLATHLGINFSGANSADSYNSTVAKANYCSYGKSPDPNCDGIVASNGQVFLQGQSNFVDRAHIHDWENNPGNNRCVRNQNPNFCQPPYRFNYDDPLNLRAQVPIVEALQETHCPATPPDLTVPQQTTVTLDPNDADLWGDQASATMNGEINGKPAHIRCLGDLTFAGATTTAIASTITVDEPLVLVLTGRMIVGNHATVHCPDCGDGVGPKARRLTIFSLTEDEGQGGNILQGVQIGNNVKFGAGIYAPNATCGNHNSNAQTEIFGSIVCSSVANKGGWEFHYDEDLGSGFTTGEYFVSRWSEG